MNKLIITSIIELEINEICDIYLLNNKNCIRINEIYNCLLFKDPISYSDLKYIEVKRAFIKLFPIHNNRKKNNTFYKISKKLVEQNRTLSELRIKPSSTLKLETYGISKEFF